MISDHYDHLTVNDGGDVTALAPTVEPGSLGVLIDDDYKGDALKLWRFTVTPSTDA